MGNSGDYLSTRLRGQRIFEKKFISRTSGAKKSA
jgi:hypothetical protein